MIDPIQIENTINALRGELAGLGQRAEVFAILPAAVREPILAVLAGQLQALREAITAIRATVEGEIARQRGDEADDYRKRFRAASE